MSSTRRSATKSAPAQSRLQRSYEDGAAARAALSRKHLLSVNLDVRLVVTTVLGAIPRLTRIHQSTPTALPGLDADRLAELRASAEALMFAHTAHLSVGKGEDRVPALVARATELLSLLMASAKPLADRDLLNGKQLARLKGSTGYLKTAMNLGVLVLILRNHWPTIASRTAIRVEELDEGLRLAEEITTALADRGTGSARVRAVAAERQRAYTLVLRGYDEVRRTVAYLRWHEGDAEKIAPSLWAGRGARSEKAKKSAPKETKAPVLEGES